MVNASTLLTSSNHPFLSESTSKESYDIILVYKIVFVLLILFNVYLWKDLNDLNNVRSFLTVGMDLRSYEQLYSVMHETFRIDSYFILQGWLFYSDSAFWKPPQMKVCM